VTSRPGGATPRILRLGRQRDGGHALVISDLLARVRNAKKTLRTTAVRRGLTAGP